MKTVNTPCKYISLESLYNFLFPNGDHVLRVDNTISPQFIYFVLLFFNFEIEVQYVDADYEVEDGEYEYKNDGDNDFKLENAITVNKKKYKYDTPEKRKYHTTSLSRFMPKKTHFNDFIIETICCLNLIDHIAYKKQSEIIELFLGVKIKPNTIWKLKDKNMPKFLSKIEEKLNKFLKDESKLDNGTVHYDESMPRIDGDNYARIVTMDSVSRAVLKDDVIEREKLNKEEAKAFILDSTKEIELKGLITDNHKMYVTFKDEFGIYHQLCVDHDIRNFNKPIYKEISKIKTTIEANNEKREENKLAITFLKAQGRSTASKRKDLKNENSRLYSENVKLNTKIREYEDYLNKIILMFKSKTMQTAINRFTFLWENIDNLPSKSATALRTTKKYWDKFFYYIENPDMPKSNNNLECYNGVTLRDYFKHLFRTVKGFKLKTRASNIRWNFRVALNDEEREKFFQLHPELEKILKILI